MTDNLDWTGQQSLLVGPMLTAQAAGQVHLDAGASILLLPAPSALARYRVWTATCTIIPQLGLPGDVPVGWTLQAHVSGLLDSGIVLPASPRDSRVYPQGMDAPFGEGLDLVGTIFGTWADGYVQLTITYSLVG